MEEYQWLGASHADRVCHFREASHATREYHFDEASQSKL